MSERARFFALNFLKRIRDFVNLEKLTVERLPKWVKSTNVKIAKLNDSNLFLFEDSPKDGDLFVDCGGVKSDLQFFLELPEYVPRAAVFRAPCSRARMVTAMNPTQTTVNSRILTELLVSIIAAFVVTILVEKIPGTEGRLPYIPINALLFLVVPLVFFMLWQLVDSFKSSKKTLATFVLVVSVYSLVIYLIAIDTGTEVVFNAQILKGLTIPICLVAGLPFVVEQSVVCFEQSTARRDAIYFPATVMWLSPLIAELLIMLRWYFQGELWNRLSYMVLGAMGTKDILFFYGFWAFLAMVFFRFFEHK